MSWRGLDRDSQFRHWQRVGLDSQENLDNFKKLVSTIEKSRSTSRNLNFILKPPFSLKSFNRDWEICWDMTFLANLDRELVNFLDENLDAAKSWLKSLDFKDLDREKKTGLYTKDSLNLELDWSRLSRSPGLKIFLPIWIVNIPNLT